MVGKGEPLVFREYEWGDELLEAEFGTKVPFKVKKEVIPDCIIVPLLGFNSEGNRLGYGGG